VEVLRLVFSLAWEMSKSFRDHEIPERAAQISYFLLFAVFPFLVALLGMLAMFDLQEQVLLLTRLLEDSLPPNISDYLVDEVNRIAFAETSGRIIVGLAVALWSSSRAIQSVISGVNAAWGTKEKRKMIVVRLLGTALTIGVMILSIVGLLVLSLGADAINWIAGQGWISVDLAGTLHIIRWPIVLFAVHSVINVIYRVGAYTPLKRLAWSTYGSLFSTAAWVLITLGYRAYVENIADLGATYGSLGVAIGLLIYFYALSVSVLVGAEIDALNWRRRQGDSLFGVVV
jgi:membrane protein